MYHAQNLICSPSFRIFFEMDSTGARKPWLVLWKRCSSLHKRTSELVRPCVTLATKWVWSPAACWVGWLLSLVSMKWGRGLAFERRGSKKHVQMVSQSNSMGLRGQRLKITSCFDLVYGFDLLGSNECLVWGFISVLVELDFRRASSLSMHAWLLRNCAATEYSGSNVGVAILSCLTEGPDA